MYFFLILGLPLGFLLLSIGAYPAEERSVTRKAYKLGLLSFVPIWLVARILGGLVPSAYGSFLLLFHEWADRILPYSALPALAYLAFYRPDERLHPGTARRRLSSFYAGALSPVGLCEATRIWGSPDPYALLCLPFLLGAICLAMPVIATAIHEGFGIGLAATIAGAVAASLAASTLPWLFLARLWPLGLLVVAATGAAAWLLASTELFSRPPAPILD
jgi:hypothetical protein